MTKQNEIYLQDCIDRNDLMIMGMYDKEQDYAILHKWGTEADVRRVLKAFKAGMRKTGLKDVFVLYTYPEFSLDQFHDFLERISAFHEFVKEHKS